MAFLFGAGTSSSINIAPIDSSTGRRTGFKPLIPGIDGLTASCKIAAASLGAEYAAAWAGIEAECAAGGNQPNIEEILGRIRAKTDALNSTDTLSGLNHANWSALDEATRKQIAGAATPPQDSVPTEIPHQDFTRWVRNATRRQPVEIFTTNYDVLFESTFDMLRVPHFDGFVGSQNTYFSPESVESDDLLPSPSWIRFWKLHGSVSWYSASLATGQRISRGLPSQTGEMILPSNRKYDESRKQPYRSLMDRLAKILARPDSLLFVCGFSFGDQHINAIILDALERHPKTHMVALAYADITESHVVSRWAINLPNVLYIGPNAGVLGQRFGPWTHRGKPDGNLTAATGGLVIPDPAEPEKPRLCAGDFNAFARFLATVSTSGGNR